ncbi:DUF2800 domain-containing protein [Fusobacterium varium]|uniref:DUF2800 domain-containing protein n=1 Tax=Fusobacterium varium ATCC 27725 TaxID=469618 RepID=A0ABM6U271_FUSVA|nr:DUF2800 domain-containing protein [Fusobacterium varium]AVQ30354.1 DUF2800 domain-containing protein [Fusobacterium varium ATCC 27725]EES64609.1 hypothetical protein FVAG_01292 [Fusobacterium varium ATCC 27725]VEH37681.1 Protein of uncharacterised function (DUF2800) [Fusobacterium varium]
MAHAILSASGASRWMACTPSARLEEQFPDSTSEYAKEGTLAHELCELKVRKNLIEPMHTRTYNSKLKKIKEHELWQDEMDRHTDTYLEYIQGLLHSFSCTPAVMVEKKVDFSSYVPDGFGTADCIIIAEGVLHVIDFKYGKGVAVSAENNSQMKLYGLGAYLEYSFLYAIDKVKMTIVQPRLDEVISEYEISVTELMEWAEEIVKPLAEKAYKGEGTYIAGNHCKFCRAKATCRERARMNLEVAKFDFKEPALLSDEEVGEALKQAQDLAKWAEDLKDYALAESLKGKLIPGWKAVEGRGSRVFTDNEEALKVLMGSGIDETMLYERKQLTLAQIEKVLGPKQFKELVGNMVEKSPGKPTLVLDTDKREAISNKTTAVEDFKEEI